MKSICSCKAGLSESLSPDSRNKCLLGTFAQAVFEYPDHMLGDQDTGLAEKLIKEITFYLKLSLKHTWIFYDTFILIIVILSNNVIFTKF